MGWLVVAVTDKVHCFLLGVHCSLLLLISIFLGKLCYSNLGSEAYNLSQRACCMSSMWTSGLHKCKHNIAYSVASKPDVGLKRVGLVVVAHWYASTRDAAIGFSLRGL